MHFLQYLLTYVIYVIQINYSLLLIIANFKKRKEKEYQENSNRKKEICISQPCHLFGITGTTTSTMVVYKNLDSLLWPETVSDMFIVLD